MGFLKSAVSAIAMATTGKVIEQMDTSIMSGLCKVSLRLKQKNDKSSPYVVLAGIASGNYQYYPMNAEEFERFANAVQRIRDKLASVNQE